jgi:hypothetical protein
MIRELWRSRPRSLAGVCIRPRLQWQVTSWLENVSIATEGVEMQAHTVAACGAEGRRALGQLVQVVCTAVKIGRLVLPRCAVVPPEAPSDTQYATKRPLQCS